MRKLVHHLAMVGAVTIGLAFATVSQAQTPVTFQLNWTAGGPNAGYGGSIPRPVRSRILRDF